MTVNEFGKILKKTGLPVVYLAFERTRVPNMPFITYLDTGTDNFSADGIVYHVITQMQVDLFRQWPFTEKDAQAEAKIEQVLQDAGIFWQKETESNDDEHCLVTTYTMEI